MLQYIEEHYGSRDSAYQDILLALLENGRLLLEQVSFILGSTQLKYSDGLFDG